MTRPVGSCVFLTCLVAAIAAATPASAIECRQGTQRVQGNWIATPYCQDQYLAQVARERGMRASAAKIRNNPNYKKELCRTLYTDIRVQTTCLNAGVPEIQRGW